MRRLLFLVPLLAAALLITPAIASATSLELDGNDSYANAGFDPTGTDLTTARTWEAWVKTTSNGETVAGAGNNYQSVIGRLRNRVARPRTEEAWDLGIRDGRPQIFIGRNPSHNGPYNERRANVTVNDGEWHHIAAVWVPGSRLDVYVDGHLSNDPQLLTYNTSSILTALPAVTPDVPMKIGVGNFQETDFGAFDGSIDGVRYSRAARYAADFTPTACPESDADTIGLWNFDEGGGSTTAPEGLATTAATLIHNAGWGRGMACADALRFDGDDDYVQAGEDPAAGDTTTARTWEAWVKTTSNAYQAVLDLTAGGAGDDPWVLDMEDGIPRIHVQDGTAHGARYGSQTVNDGEWHHLAAVWQPGSRLDLYVDGHLTDGPLGGGAVPTSIAAAPDAAIRIGLGHRDGHDAGHFDGDLDGVRYSRGARYEEDFTPEPCPSLDGDTIALWTFSEGSGTTTASVGELAEDAVLVDGPSWVAGKGCSPHDALLLDGQDSYADAGLDPSGSDLTTARTWEAWVKTTSLGQPTVPSGATPHYQTVIGRLRNRAVRPRTEEAWELGILEGKPEIFIGRNASHNGPFNVRKANVAVNDGQWHHIAAVWDPGTRLSVYVDGQNADGDFVTYPANLNQVLSALPVVTPDVPMKIGVGNFQDMDYGFFDGAIDGVMYSLGARYPGATPSVHPTAEANTIALWNFDEGEGTSTAPTGQLTAATVLRNGAGWTFGPNP